MFITRIALEDAQLEVTLDEHGLSVQGSKPMPEQVRKNCKHIVSQLGYTPQEHDELINYVANVTVWRTLKGITSI